MREISNRQEGKAHDTRKRFYILWVEKTDCIAEVRARNKKEALDLFYRGDDQIWTSLECGQSEMARKPSIREVKA